MSVQSRKSSDESGDGDGNHVSRAKEVKVDLVQTTNNLDPDTFAEQYIDAGSIGSAAVKQAGDIAYRLEYKSAKHIAPGDLQRCYSLIEKTSRHDYETSSMRWRPRHKKQEMRDKDLHYILVKTDDLETAVCQSTAGSASSFKGFLSFMITFDSTPAVPVLYIYEIHLCEDVRHLGLGRDLMRIAQAVATKIGLAKIMLTCFVSNETALSFYQRHGFAKDVCSPEDRITRKTTVKSDYMIMSKDIAAG